MNIPLTEPDIVYDIAGVAKKLKCHPDTVRALIRSNQLRAKRLGKQRAFRIPAQSLRDYLARKED